MSIVERVANLAATMNLTVEEAGASMAVLRHAAESQNMSIDRMVTICEKKPAVRNYLASVMIQVA